MTYNEWRDELKANLLCVSDGERRRVLDYYAEAYADRRDAGFSEREIIDDFGAPYDAAQRILAENREEYGSYSSHGEKHDAYGADSRGCTEKTAAPKGNRRAKNASGTANPATAGAQEKPTVMTTDITKAVTTGAHIPRSRNKNRTAAILFCSCSCA